MMNEQGGVEKGFFTLNLLEKGIFSGLRLDPSGPPLPGEVFTPLDFSPVLASMRLGTLTAQLPPKWPRSGRTAKGLSMMTLWRS